MADAPVRLSRQVLVDANWTPDVVERQIPLTEGRRPLSLLTDDTEMARWGNEGLPADSLSVENGAIMCSCARWPLMIDPQLQGVQWVKAREAAHGLRVIQLSAGKYMDTVEACIEAGTPLLIENLGDTIDAVLEPVISRSVIRRGRNLLIKLGDKEVAYDPNFRLYLHTKLSNPHYKPEIAAQTTLINFRCGPAERPGGTSCFSRKGDCNPNNARLLSLTCQFLVTMRDICYSLPFKTFAKGILKQCATGAFKYAL